MSTCAVDRPRRVGTQGFTLLEVMVALAILTVSVLVMMDVQSTSANMTVESERMMLATMLAQDQLVQHTLALENKGFASSDVEESGDFQEDYPNEFPEYRWESAVRRMDVSGAAAGLSALLSAASDTGEEEKSDQPGDVEDRMEQGMQLLGMGPEFLSEELGRFIREVRIRVYWKFGEHEDYVELVHHVINPSGKVDDSQEQAEDAQESAGGTQ